MILCLSSAYAEEGDDSWLDAARPEEEPEEAEPEDASDPSVSDFRTFGTQLDLFGLDVSWSGYGDLLFEWAPYEREMTFEASHFNPILGAIDSPSWRVELDLGGGVKVIERVGLLGGMARMALGMIGFEAVIGCSWLPPFQVWYRPSRMEISLQGGRRTLSHAVDQ